MSGIRKHIAVVICLALLLYAGAAFAQKVNTVVLDAGHGGHDTGALGKHSREKDITMDVVLKLRDYIRENLKDVKVILTRDNDEFIELYRRARIANENKADLFISIHCNSTRSAAAYGTETFVMGLHKSEANLAVAQAENAAILLEDDYVEQYDGFDPTSPEGTIFFSMMQNAFLDNSLLMAGNVQKQFTKRLGKFSRGVKQAGFLVLYKTAMPGILVELGFLSHPSDESFLLSQKGQSQLAYSVYRALAEYKASVEGTPLALDDKEDFVQAPGSGEADSVNRQTGQEDQTTQKSTADAGMNKVLFRVQFATSPTRIDTGSVRFRGIPDVRYYEQGGLFKYTAGECSTLSDALELRKNLVVKGYKDAFVVAFRGEKRITLEEAKQIDGN